MGDPHKLFLLFCNEAPQHRICRDGGSDLLHPSSHKMMAPLHASVRQCLTYCRNTRTSKIGCHFLGRPRSFKQGMFRPLSLMQRDNHVHPSVEDTRAAQVKHSLPGVTVARNGSKVVISFDEEDRSTFDAPWLWSNDPSRVHPTSGQRLRSPGGYSNHSSIESATIVSSTNESVPAGVVLPFPPPPKGSSHPVGNLYESNEETPTDALCLKVTWKTTPQTNPQVSYYNLDWLEQWRYDEEAINKRRAQNTITPVHALQSDGRIPTFDYKDMAEDPKEFEFQLLSVSDDESCISFFIERCQ